MPAENENHADVQTNQSPNDARNILDSYKLATIKEFVVSEVPDAVSVEKMEAARLSSLKKEVNDSLDEIRNRLDDVAHVKGVDLDHDTVKRLDGAAQALERAEEAVDQQLDLFSNQPDGGAGDGTEIETMDVEGNIDAADGANGEADLDLSEHLGDELRAQHFEALEDAGITTVDELVELSENDELDDVPGIGPAGSDLIEAALERNGSVEQPAQ